MWSWGRSLRKYRYIIIARIQRSRKCKHNYTFCTWWRKQSIRNFFWTRKTKAWQQWKKGPCIIQYHCKVGIKKSARRVVMSVPNIFYRLKKLQIKQIQDSAESVRKKENVSPLKSWTLNNLVHLDEGFRVLKSVQGSPPYFEKCKKDLFAKISQLNSPTWSWSFSTAKTRWTNLLKNCWEKKSTWNSTNGLGAKIRSY